ncbi:hypothetical protein D3C80_1219400 [compost metagenome]
MRVQFTTKFAESIQRQHFLRINMNIVRFEQGSQRFGVGGVKTGMHVVDAKA